MRLPICLVLLLCGASARAGTAGYEFNVVPDPATSSQQISVTISNTQVHCFPLPATLAYQSAGNGVLVFDMLVSDACFNAPPESRTYSIGTLPAGRYTFRFVACGGNPPPGGATGCGELGSVAVTVYGVFAKPFTVAALTSLGAVALAAALLLLGAVLARR